MLDELSVIRINCCNFSLNIFDNRFCRWSMQRAGQDRSVNLDPAQIAEQKSKADAYLKNQSAAAPREARRWSQVSLTSIMFFVFRNVSHGDCLWNFQAWNSFNKRSTFDRLPWRVLFRSFSLPIGDRLYYLWRKLKRRLDEYDSLEQFSPLDSFAYPMVADESKICDFVYWVLMLFPCTLT